MSDVQGEEEIDIFMELIPIIWNWFRLFIFKMSFDIMF
jgi:hypothetical protein